MGIVPIGDLQVSRESGRPVTAPVPRPASHVRRLRISAWVLTRMLRDPGRLPDRWSSDRFGRRVDHVRAQLRPIGSLAALVDSYAREHRVGGPEVALRVLFRAPAEVELAYALRWLELTGSLPQRSWSSLCGRPAE